MPNVVPQFVAGGDIYPCRFVKISGDFTVQQADDPSDVLLGVAQEGSNQPPLSDLVTGTPKAAGSGQPIHIFTEGDVCLLEVGETVYAGELLTTDSAGKGARISSSDTSNVHYGAVVLQGGAAGEKIMVQVRFGTIRPSEASGS